MTSSARIGLVARRTSLRSQYQSQYICLQCQRLASSATRTSTLRNLEYPTTRRHASFLSTNKLTDKLTNKLRKKIWGSETPPGPDPYEASGAYVQPYLQHRKEIEMRWAKEKEKEKGRELVPAGERVAEEDEEEDEDVKSEELMELEDEEGEFTWNGMKVVGGPNWGNAGWYRNNRWTGFMRNRMEDRFEIISAVHRALVEVFALKQAGLPLKIHSEAGVPEDEYVYRVAKGAKFEPNADGDMVLVFEDDELQQFILDNIRPRETPVGPETVEEEDLAEEELANRDGETGLDHESSTLGIAQTDDVIQASESNKSSTVENPWDQNDDPAVFMPMDNSWREVSLDNSYTKFSVLKRVMQLTGRRIADPDIEGITTPKALLVHLVKKPKPKKIAENLLSNEVARLPNVEIYDRRYTPIDREMEVGRWKVVEEELTRRGLPVIGGPEKFASGNRTA